MAHADIIIYGLIALVLLARLWVVFGRRNEEDQQRPNPFAMPAPDPHDEGGAVVRPGRAAADAQASAFAPLLVAPTSLAGALERVKQLDPGFDEKQFLKDMRGTFTAIVGAFAKGDLAPVQGKFGSGVQDKFQTAIDARKKSGETLENKINRIRDVEVSSAQADENRAFITIRFVSEQENILRDASGTGISGEKGKPEEITDLWTFTRDAKSDWQLIETKS